METREIEKDLTLKGGSCGESLEKTAEADTMRNTDEQTKKSTRAD